MNKSRVKPRIVLLIIAVAGLVLFCIGAIMGGSLSSIPATFHLDMLPEGAVSIEDAPVSDITALEVNLRSSDITFKTGKIFDIAGTGLSDSYVKDGILYAGSSDTSYSAKVFGINLQIPSRWLCGYGSYVITIPDTAALERITVNGSNCTIQGDRIAAKTIEIKDKTYLSTHSGNFSMEQISSDSLSLDIFGGKITIPALEVTGTGTLKATSKISIGSKEATTGMNNLTTKTTFGGTALTGQLTGSCSITSTFGGNQLLLRGGDANYSIQAAKGDLDTTPATATDITTDHYADISVCVSHNKTTVNYY